MDMQIKNGYIDLLHSKKWFCKPIGQFPNNIAFVVVFYDARFVDKSARISARVPRVHASHELSNRRRVKNVFFESVGNEGFL